MGLLDEWIRLEGGLSMMRPRGCIERVRFNHGLVATMVLDSAIQLALNPSGNADPVRGVNHANA